MAEEVPFEELTDKELLREARRAQVEVARKRRWDIRTGRTRSELRVSKLWVEHHRRKFEEAKTAEHREKLMWWRNRMGMLSGRLRVFEEAGEYGARPTSREELDTRAVQREYRTTQIETIRSELKLHDLGIRKLSPDEIKAKEKELAMAERELKEAEESVSRLEEELAVVAPTPFPRSPEEFTSWKEYEREVRKSIFERKCPSYKEIRKETEEKYVGAEREKQIRSLGRTFREKISEGVEDVEDIAGRLWEARLPSAMEVKGIGPKRARRLRETLRIHTLTDLAKASPPDVARALRVTTKTAEKWVKEAKRIEAEM